MIRYLLALLAAALLSAPAAAATLPVSCDGKTDIAVPLQRQINAAKSGDAVQLTAGVCLYSKAPIIKGKIRFTLAGAGKDLTTLKALDSLQSSVIVFGGDTIRLAGFTVESFNDGTLKFVKGQCEKPRCSDPTSKGFFISQGARNVTLTDLRAKNVRGAGILLCGVSGASVTFSEVRRSLADAYHITCGSRDVLLQFNLAEGMGDDGFASIGYKEESPNRNIAFLDNVGLNGVAGCGHFDTTQGGKFLRNKCSVMGVSCVAVSTDAKWSDGSSSGIEIAYNVLDRCVTNTRYDHGAISIYAANGGLHPMTDITVGPQNIVSNARTPAFKAWGKARIAAAVNDNTFCAVKKDFAILTTTATITRSGNTVAGVC